MATPRLQILGSTALAPTDRVGRYPKHTFNVRSKPFSVTPICIAPVLPGETINSLFMESRVVTDPIKNPIVGWKKDYFFFYIKATTIYGDDMRAMVVDLQGNQEALAGYKLGGNDANYYTAKGAQPYLMHALTHIVNNYFRDEGEGSASVPTINGYPAAQIRESSWLDSLTDKDLVPQQAELDAAADTGDLERLTTAFEQLRSMGLANITFEEYLATFGISPETVEQKDKPELLFHTNDFQYPSNTVNPADGTPSSAVSWVFRQGETKKRKFFKEPGFIIGITVTRPKVYFAGLAGNLAGHLDRAWDWMPELLIGMPGHSLKKFEPGTGPLGDRTIDTDGYFVDMRDLFTKGDQFQNRVSFDPEIDADASVISGVALPDAGLNWKYPTEAMTDSLFKSGASAFIREDGYVSLSIKGKQRDHTPASNLLTALTE